MKKFVIGIYLKSKVKMVLFIFILTGLSACSKTDDLLNDTNPCSKISVGVWHSLIVDSSGNLWGMGADSFGELGDGMSNDEVSEPEKVKTGFEIQSVAAGYEGTLCLDKMGNLWAWGKNYYGQSEDNKVEVKLSPEQIIIATKFRKIAESRGDIVSLALDVNGNLWGWGNPFDEQLGSYPCNSLNHPGQILLGKKFLDISMGEDFTLAIDTKHNLWSWGGNDEGQLGLGGNYADGLPALVKTNKKFKSVAAGLKHAVAIDVDGNLWAWGSNIHGEIGDGKDFTDIMSPSIQGIPKQIMQGTRFMAISAGSEFTLAIDINGNLWGWGEDTAGQLGDGGTDHSVSLPQQIMKGIKFCAIASGTTRSLAIDESGNVWSWGGKLDGSLPCKLSIKTL